MIREGEILYAEGLILRIHAGGPGPDLRILVSQRVCFQIEDLHQARDDPWVTAVMPGLRDGKLDAG